MLSRVRNVMILLRGQIWLIPVIMIILTMALAYFLLTNKYLIGALEDADLWWIYGGDASSARELLSSLLSGLMTMTSLVVSITFVVLTLAANQLGPRLIETFMADRQIQAVLGLFLSTILYVLIVLRTLEDELEKEAVPHIAVTVGSGLTIICLITLLFYLHKVARSIVADNVIATTATELQKNIRDILPEQVGGAQDDLPHPELRGGTSVSLERSGYIQTIDYDALVKLARQKEVVLKVEVRSGHFLLKRGDHVRVHCKSDLDEDVVTAIRKAFVIGQKRTSAQDLEYGIRQLVEIALRALSTGINDPFTALVVIDRLGVALEEVLAREPLPGFFRDEDGEIRVVADRLNEGAIDAAFDLIREAGANQPLVLLRIADVLGQLAPVLHDDAAQRAVLSQLEKLDETAGHAPFAASDQQQVMQHIEGARTAVEQRSGSGLSES
jgi:uncharacterized membrane protein